MIVALRCGLASSVLLFAHPTLAQEQLPVKNRGEVMDFEPTLRLYDVKPEKGRGPVVEWEAGPADESKARRDADQAALMAQRWEQLQRRGIVSKVEAERARLRAGRASLRYQKVHVATLRAELDKLKERAAKGEAAPEMVESAASALATAERLAADAEAVTQKTELEFARNNVERQRLLLKAGIGSKVQLTRAEAELARLTTPKAE